MTRKLYISAIVLILGSCATGPYPVTSPYYHIPSGSQIELHQALTIPPNNGRVYLQYGKVVSAKEKDRYQANCWFTSWKVLETSQIINPDSFTVLRSQKNEDLVYNISNIKLVSSSINIGITVGAGISANHEGGDAPIATEFTTQFYIHSEKQPDIRLLECSHWDDPSSGEHLTVQQMQDALGKIATIKIG